MSEETFLVAVKSTIDKMVNDMALAEVPAVSYADLDNVVNTAALFESDDDALVWEMLNMDARPQDPLYLLSFNVGARTVNDPANYDMMKLVGKVKAAFAEKNDIPVFDYSGATVGPKLGFLYIVDVGINPQEFDKVSGVRLATVVARAARG